MRMLNKKPKKRSLSAFLYLIPWLAFLLVFTVYPFLYGIAVSFTNFSLQSSKFIGLDNYLSLFEDRAFITASLSTLKYAALVIPSTVLIAVWIAATLQRRGPKENAFFKCVFYLNAVTSQTALVIVWMFLLAPTYGVFAGILSKLGVTNISWFDKPITAIPILSFLVLTCSLGQPVILFSAAMGSIPESYYEAAALEGASKSQQFWKITWPLLHSTTTFVVVTTTIAVLQIFVVPYLMTGGGPSHKTSSLLLRVYQTAFLNGHFGLASAIGIVLFMLTCVVAAVQFRMMKRDIIEY